MAAQERERPERDQGEDRLISGRRSSGGAAPDPQVGLASYLFPMDLACERECASVNLGGTVPVATDGVFHYKRAWGARIVPRAETAEGGWIARAIVAGTAMSSR